MVSHLALRRFARAAWLAALLGLCISADATAQGRAWTGSWGAAQMLAGPEDAAAPADLTDATLRQVVRLSIGGTRLRLRLSNAFGTAPLALAAVHVARAPRPGSPRIDSATDHAVTFGGRTEVTIPPGADYLSDPVDLTLAPLAWLAVSIRYDTPPARQTGHPGSRTTSYLVHGDRLAAADLPEAATFDHWLQISGVEVATGPASRAVVAFGDSITDGHGATANGDNRWPDLLAARLLTRQKSVPVGVLNAGIGGNRVLLDGLGPNALARFDRDVLSPAGVHWLIVLEGVNDLGTLTREHLTTRQAHAALVGQIIQGYRQIVERARAHGIRAIGGTILPYAGSDYYHPDAANEQDRQAVNRWIRTPGNFDALIDFDRAMHDPAQPDRLLPVYDSGDHLHPSLRGYAAMAEAIPLTLFAAKP